MINKSDKHFWYDTKTQEWKPRCKFCIEGLSYGKRRPNCPLDCKGDSNG